jgi:DNA-binding NarL/FixJ family response regulator
LTQKIRVVLAEDQSMLRGALAALLSIETDIEVLGSFSDGEQALQAVGKHRPEVLVTDIEMPKMSGLELTARCKRALPRHARPDTNDLRASGKLAASTGSGSVCLSSQGPAL